MGHEAGFRPIHRCVSHLERPLLHAAAGAVDRIAPRKGGDRTMLSWALTFFVIALIAAVLGFSGVAGMSANIGWLLAVLGVIVLVVGLISHNVGGRPTLP